MHKGTHYDFSVYYNCYIITPKKHPALQTSRPQSGVFILRTSFFRPSFHIRGRIERPRI
ncbi:MAG: hypothetical protein IJK49_02835 [Prevotella sp.]|nr:hypothetical protein [Prevotella sp.]